MNKRKIIAFTFPSLFLSIYVISAFIMHLVTYASNGTVYCGLIAVCTLSFCFTKPIIKYALPKQYIIAWFLAISILWINYITRYQSNTVLIDDVVMTFGLLIILLFSNDIRDYNAAIKTILCMAYIFTIGVFLQRYIPSVYQVVIRILPDRMQMSLGSNAGKGGIKGFSTNVGFTASYILVGVFALLSAIHVREKPETKRVTKVLVLLFAVLLTGKRGPLFFSILSIFLVGLIPVRGMEKMKKVWKTFLVVLAIAIVFFSMGEILEQIPVLGRYIESINEFIQGEDISSGRTRLYMWAIQLFEQNPIIGIGWGKYRTTVMGNATLLKSFDTHNVYLQLLCETGIIGFIIFATVFLMSWTMAKNAYCSCLTECNEELRKWRPALFFSFLFQTYFLLMSLTGNPLYDQFYQVIYTFTCSIVIAYRYVAINELVQ